MHIITCTLKLNHYTYCSGLICEVHPFPRSYVFPPQPSLGLSVPATNVCGNEGGGGGTVLVVRVEEGVHLTIHSSRSTNTT